jgi:antitoxin component YwqK of YwqJK toxin-antitoxin module
MKNLMILTAMLSSSLVLAADPVLSCPVGTKQIGGAKTALEAVVCVKADKEGGRIFHGPYIAFWPNGKIQAQGAYENGWRSGTFTFFDQAGVKTGTTEFKHGDYDGVRVEFHPNGMKKLEEMYVAGNKQAPGKQFDVTGKPIAATGAAATR